MDATSLHAALRAGIHHYDGQWTHEAQRRGIHIGPAEARAIGKAHRIWASRQQDTAPRTLSERLESYRARRDALRLYVETHHAVERELDGVQRRCTQRKVGVEYVMRMIRDCARTGTPGDSGREYAASSYGYRYTWTQARVERVGDYVHWGVERCSAAYEAHTDSGSVHVDAITPWTGAGALHGEICRRRRNRHGVLTRYSLETGRRTGVAIDMPRDLRHRYGRWEHGRTREECRHEIRRKRAVIASERAEARRSARDERRAQLLARLSHRITARYDDARAAGYCSQGIAAWARERNIPLDGRVPLATLARDPHPSAVRVALLVARRAVARRRSLDRDQ